MLMTSLVHLPHVFDQSSSALNQDMDHQMSSAQILNKKTAAHSSSVSFF